MTEMKKWELLDGALRKGVEGAITGALTSVSAYLIKEGVHAGLDKVKTLRKKEASDGE